MQEIESRINRSYAYPAASRGREFAARPSGLILPSVRTEPIPRSRRRLRRKQERAETGWFDQWSPGARRAVNVVAALVLIALTAPVMLLVAAAVKLTSRGPVFYTQPRVGIDRRQSVPGVPVDPRRRHDMGGRVFHIIKFRTMTHRPDDADQQVWATYDDPRVTAVGRILRKFRMDELPQLFNVLRGDMNLVGPRPEQPRIFGELREEINDYQRRQRVLPGITGLAQVYLNYDHTVEDVRRKVRLDLAYVERASLLEDVRIMLRTIPVVLFGWGSR